MSNSTISLLGKINVSQIEGLEDIMDIIQNSLDLSEIEQEITDNELVVSYALNDLNDRINDITTVYDHKNKIPMVSGTPAASVSIDPYKLYNFGTVNISMTISFDTTKEVSGYCAEYIFRFVAGNSCNIILPNSVQYSGGQTPTFVSGHTYEYSITDNLCVVGEFYS